MSTLVDPAGTRGQSQPPNRGRLVVEKQVIERIASQAASESRDTGGSSGGMLGFGAQADLSARPNTTVELVGQSATVALDLTVAYPTPIRAATDRVRRHVVDRVRQLAGVEVTRLDITVTSLHAQPTTARRVQ